MVYRVYPDGREELVRGVDLIGTPLTVFSKVTAADDQIEVFNGMCWAESGAVPVSAVSPGVLLSQVEVQKQAKGSERPPLLSPPLGNRAPLADDPLHQAMRDEMARSMEHLRLDTLPRPYFIAYRVREVNRATVSATFGSVLQDHETRARRLEVEVRVGDYDFDNTNFFSFPDAQFVAGLAADYMVLPLDDDYREVRRRLWLATDAAYKQAVQQLAQKRAALSGRTRTDDVPDLSREPPVTIADTVAPPPEARAAGVALVRHLSGLFRRMPEVTWSSVSWHAATVRTLYLNSEGTAFVRLVPEVSVQVEAATQAADGAPIEDFVSFRGRTSGDLPDRDALSQEVRRLGERIGRLRQAALPATYAGPVLFEGQAAAELFHQVFAPRLTATRVPVGDNPQFAFLMGQLGNPFVDAIGSRVLPAFLSVADDATAAEHEGTALPVYRVDDDGVPTRRTSLVERGILKTLLAGRVPVRGILRSTGNRFGEGAVVTNLFVSTTEGLSDSELRKRLLDLAAQRGYPYAVVVRRVGNPAVGGMPEPSEIVSGFMSMLGPGGPGTSALIATEAFKLYPDGREERLRNSEIIGLSAATFKDIVAASRDRVVHATPGAPALSFSMPIPFPLPIPALEALSGGLRPTYMVPSLLFEDVSLRGPRGELPRPLVAPHPFFQRRP